MKTMHIIFILGCFAFLNAQTTFAQSTLAWHLPSVEIPLIQDGRMIASMKARFISKSATVSYNGLEYELTLKKDRSSCTVTILPTQQGVFTVRHMGRREIEVDESLGKSFIIQRTGKKKNQRYLKDGQPFLTVKNDHVIVEKNESEVNELLVQAVLIFRLTYKQYDSDRSSTVVYYPIASSAGQE